MRNVSGAIAEILYSHDIIQKEDIDICRYGLDVFISSVFEIASILIIAIFAGNFFETVLFFTVFIPLRIYAGGYHADTKLKCYLVSLVVYGIFTIIINRLPQELYSTVSLIMTIFSLIMVAVAAPVIHKNKTANKTERKHYRKFSICICAFETAMILLLTSVFPKNPYIVSLAIGQVSVAFSMIAAIVKGKIADNKN